MIFVRIITFALVVLLWNVAGNVPMTGQTPRTNSRAAAADLIDINKANTAQLKALPGIGDAYAAAIVKNRPYKNKTQLVSGGVIPQAAFNKIKAKIIAKQ